MKSPFPGMDPYIEDCGLWKEFHILLIAEIFRVLSEALPKGYAVRAGERSYIVLIEGEEKKERHFEPDVTVTAPQRKPGGTGRGAAASPVALSESADSVAVRAFLEEDFTERFIDIYELEPERRLVTSIEVLSPSNKRRRSKGWRKYLRKRQALLLGKANLVEIDLLRGGTRMPMLDPMPDSPYYVLVAREERTPDCRAWRAHFDRPLPVIPVPLSRPDPDIQLALQPLIDTIYQRGRYDEVIDYTKPLTPPLRPEEGAWLKERLQASATPAKPSSRQPRKRRR
jgi:hypothetical protein